MNSYKLILILAIVHLAAINGFDSINGTDIDDKKPNSITIGYLNGAGTVDINNSAKVTAAGKKPNHSDLPNNIYSSVTSLYTGMSENGLITFSDGFQISFSGSYGEITLGQIKKVFETHKALLKERYGTTVLEDLKKKILYVAHSHPQNMRPGKNISLIFPPRAVGPTFTASEEDFNFIKITGIKHYVIDQTTIALIDKNGNFVNSWWWRDDGTLHI